MCNNKIVRQANLFEEFILSLFCKLGYKVEDEFQEDTVSNLLYRRADFIAKKEEKTYCIKVKFSRISEGAIKQVYEYTKGTDAIPVLVTAFEVKEKEKCIYKEKYPELEIIDISNLLYVVKDKDKLKSKLNSMLPFSVEDIFPTKPLIDIGFLHHNDNDNDTKSLIKKLNSCQSGKEFFSVYENVCCDILKSLFSKDLTLWKEQKKSNNNLYRFDLLCRIKDDNKKTFWSIVENYFKSKYVIFEFKNYSE
ncbi:hypothetical protein [Haemophilus haemolyticus]|uniref:hypothetical protein n=1 Tax=Haemophilus haemolyticus TaxID=726 RepID=UPI000E593DE7|nr:hypothetical protein [Haemophilus haemolyticus]